MTSQAYHRRELFASSSLQIFGVTHVEVRKIIMLSIVIMILSIVNGHFRLYGKRRLYMAP